VVVTTLVPVEVVAGVAATAVVVEAEDGLGPPWADAIPTTAPRNPPTDSRAAATLARPAGGLSEGASEFHRVPCRNSQHALR
jgi:hypothetical protein